MIRAHTLGALELFQAEGVGDEVPAALKWRKNSALLVYLALSPGRSRSREHLCGLLWPEKPESAAKHSLNEALRTIRQAVGEHEVESDGRQVRLTAQAVGLDTDEFEDAVSDEAWARAAALVRGPFLDGFGVPDASGFEDWLAARREAWRSRCAEALVRCADGCLEAGSLADGAELGERALALDPYSDLAAQVVIRAAALAGDRGRALSRYEAIARRLERDLGAEPAPETQRLADRVRRERTWRLPPALEATATAEARIELLGREGELGRLLRAWSRTVDGPRAGLLAIGGEPGVGKTRLLEEAASRVRLAGGHVAGIRSVSADRRIEWSALVGLARGGLLEMPGLFEAPPEAHAAFAERVPEWRERFAELIEGATPSPLPRAFSDVIRAATEEQALLLFVDDAEWLDAGSRSALGLLLRDMERGPLMIALSAQMPSGRELFDELAEGLTSEANPALIEVARWDEAVCEELVSRTLPEFSSTARARLVRRILADSAGLPLLAIELVRAVRAGLDLEDGGARGGWPDTNRTLEHTLPGELPDAVRSAIRMHFRRLSAGARDLLAAAAVAGERFEPGDVAERVGLPAETRDAALTELEWHRWIQSEPRGYSFVGRIVREIVAEDLLTPGQRRRWSETSATERGGDGPR